MRGTEYNKISGFCAAAASAINAAEILMLYVFREALFPAILPIAD